MKRVKTQFFTFADNPRDPFVLQCQSTLRPVTLAYETYGNLSAERDNAVLVFHAFSGSQHAAGFNPSVPGVGDLWVQECHRGWWDSFIGERKAIDTRRFFVICANYLGSCYGSTGPRSVNPSTGKPYGGKFPPVRANDIVDSQVRLLEHLGVGKLHAVVGGSLGGMLAVNLATRFPGRVRHVVLIGSGLHVTTLQRIHNFEQILAIEEDPNFNEGDYYGGPAPEKGLVLARMIAHKTFVSLKAMRLRARRQVVHQERNLRLYQLTDPVESYLLYQGKKFVRRFDANSYLRIIDMWQHYDLLRDTGHRNYYTLFSRCRQQNYLVFSIDSDVCYYPEEQEALVSTLRKSRVPCHYVTVHSEKGHDSFLIEPHLYAPHISYVLLEK